MKRIKFFVFLMFGLLSVSAGLFSINFYSTVSGMRAAAAGRVGTAIYEGRGLFVMIWPFRDQYGFAMVNQAGDVVDDLARMANGNGTTVWRVSDLIGWMENNGFRKIDPKALPLSMSQVLLSQFMVSVANGSRSLITPVFVPAMALDTYQMLEDIRWTTNN